MATLECADSKPMYLWWWLSHISPKNSIWLQENLKDMDAKVKQMIRLIEEDAESFSSRGEIYYKKRPVLKELVEEFYRTHRALAERYDHATGVIRQAHRIMAEAVPNQVPLLFIDKSLGSSCGMADEHMLSSALPLNDPYDELSKDVSSITSSHSHDFKRNEAFAKESCTQTNKKGLKQVNDLLISDERVRHAKLSEGKAGRSMSCNGVPTGNESGQENELEACSLYESRNVGKNEEVVLALKESLTKSEVEREADLPHYQQSLERMSNLEFEVSQAQEKSRRLDERANKVEDEIEMIKKALTKLGTSKEASLLQFRQGLDRVSNSESCNYLVQKNTEVLYDSADKAESDWESLRRELTKVEAEKEAAMVNYRHCFERQMELDRLWTCLQEKLLRSMEAERAFLTMQHSHSKSQEEQQSMATEHKDRSLVRQEMEINYNQDLENYSSLSDAELEGLRAKVKDLEESVESLKLEKSNLISEKDFLSSQLQTKTEVLKRLSQKNQCLDSSIFDSKTEFEILRANFNDLKDSYLFLDNDKSSAEAERENLPNMLNITQQALNDLERRHMMMNEKYMAHEERRKLLLQKLKELHIPLNAEKENLSRFINIIFEEMDTHYDRVKMLQQDPEKQILISAEECDRQRKENQSLPEANKELEPELVRLVEEIDETKISIECSMNCKNEKMQCSYGKRRLK